MLQKDSAYGAKGSSFFENLFLNQEKVSKNKHKTSETPNSQLLFQFYRV